MFGDDSIKIVRQICSESGTALHGFDLKQARKSNAEVDDLVTFLETALAAHVQHKSVEKFDFVVTAHALFVLIPD